MGEVISMRSGVLDPEAMRAILKAYCAAIEHASTLMPVDDAARAEIATGIFELAELGVRDPTLLMRDGVRRLVSERLGSLQSCES
jgi:hypothetical protein